MRYEFVSEGCPKAGPGCDGCMHELEFPMKDAPAIGATVKCPVKGCRRVVLRVISSGVSGVIKGAAYDWKPGESMRMTMPDGRDCAFSFVDHPHTDPQYQRNLAKLGNQNGLTTNTTGLSKARFDEKSGRIVVDVASNIPDPLGAMERAKKSAGVEKIPVKQKYKVRPKKKK